MQFIRKYGFIIVSVAALVVTALGYGAISANLKNEQSARDHELHERERELTARERQLLDESQQAYDELLGTDHGRIARDSEIIEELLDTALTWDDEDSYTLARESVMYHYDLDETSHFVQTYLQESPVNTDAAGNTYSYINAAGLNSKLGGIDTQVLSVVRTDYRYLVSVTAESVSNDGGSTAANTSVVFVTIDGDGDISEISGYAEDVDFPRRSSGAGFQTPAESNEVEG